MNRFWSGLTDGTKTPIPLADPTYVPVEEYPDANPIPPVPHVEALLSKIVDLLSQDRQVDTESDYLQAYTFPITIAIAGQIEVPTEMDFGYWHIYNAPASGRVGFGSAFSHPIGTFAAGETVWGKVPRGQTLVIQYDAPTASGTFIVKLGTRPLEYYTDPNPLLLSGSQQAVTIVDPTTLFGASVGFAADALTNVTLGMRTDSLTHVFNGVSWDRLRGSIATGALTDVARTRANNLATFGQIALAAGVATQIRALDAGRSVIWLTNIGATPAFVGSSAAVTAANGHALPPNIPTPFPCVGALFGFNAVGVTVTFADYGI